MSDIEARREARRQRILNNSANRLKKILGETNEDPGIVVLLKQKKFLTNTWHLVVANHGAATKRHELSFHEDDIDRSSDVLRTYSYHNSHDNLERNTDDITTTFANSQQNSKQSATEITDLASRYRVRKYLVIVLAVIVRLLLIVCEMYSQYFFRTNFADLHMNNIFIPFLAYEVVEFVYFRLPVQKNSFVMSILYLRFKPTVVDRLIVVFDVVSKLSQDLLLYFFAFVVSSYLIDSRTLERWKNW